VRGGRLWRSRARQNSVALMLLLDEKVADLPSSPPSSRPLCCAFRPHNGHGGGRLQRAGRRAHQTALSVEMARKSDLPTAAKQQQVRATLLVSRAMAARGQGVERWGRETATKPWDYGKETGRGIWKLRGQSQQVGLGIKTENRTPKPKKPEPKPKKPEPIKPLYFSVTILQKPKFSSVFGF
jgi:hypothetical protein